MRSCDLYFPALKFSNNLPYESFGPFTVIIGLKWYIVVSTSRGIVRLGKLLKTSSPFKRKQIEQTLQNKVLVLDLLLVI